MKKENLKAHRGILNASESNAFVWLFDSRRAAFLIEVSKPVLQRLRKSRRD
jgi:hypothetical protein